MEKLSQFVKDRRKRLGLTQEDLSFKAGVGLRFVRDLEQGKEIFNDGQSQPSIVIIRP